MTSIYTAEDVAKHNLKTDLWVSIHGKVYDITTYLEDHPGGVPSLVEVAGQNATEAFEELGHTQHARDVMERFLVGKLDHDEDELTPTIKRHPAPEPETKPTTSHNITSVVAVAQILSIGAIVVLSFVLTRKVGQVINVQTPWSIRCMVKNALPWLTSTSLASILIPQYVKRTYPNTTPVNRPAHFKVAKANATSKPKSAEGTLKPGCYIDLPISSVEKLSMNSNKIVLDLPKPDSVLGLPIGQHVTIRSTIDGKEVSRQYTPTSSDKDLGRLELVIKNYDDGLLTGQYLKNVQKGHKISLSGPKGQMHYRRGLAKTINMIAGGTGITPMYQIIRAICEDTRDNTKMVLIYANQTEQDILLKTELDDFAAKHSDQLQVHYLLSKPTGQWTGRVGRCTQDTCKELFDSGADKQNKAMICGPPGMVDSAKEWLAAMDYDNANAVSRMADQVFIF